LRQPRTVIPLPDYERIFRVIYTVLDTRANTPHACIFFALVGTAILEMHYKLKAQPFAGAAAYVVSAETATVSTFGKLVADQLVSSRDTFHCWIECNGVAIDFMAPLFQESLKTYGHTLHVPRRMFQKLKTEMSPSLHEMCLEGAYFLLPNPALTNEIIQEFSADLTSTDLANVCTTWFRRPPKQLANNFRMRDDLGNVYPLELKGPQLSGVW